MGSIILMRHGQAQNNVERRLTGRTAGVSLTEEGKRQAASTAGLLEGISIDAVYASPLERTAETARIVCDRIGADPVYDERLIELDMGKFTGSTYESIQKEHGDVFFKFYDQDPAIASLGVETFGQVRIRVSEMIAHAASRHPGSNVLLVTHMDPIKAAVASAMRLEARSIHDMIIANASLTAIGWHEGSSWIKAINVMGLERLDQAW